MTVIFFVGAAQCLLLAFINIFIYEKCDLIRKFGSLKRALLFARKNGKGKTGTNMFNWRDVFEHYFKKILSIIYVFNVHYLSL